MVKTVVTKPSELKQVRREELIISTIAVEPEEGQQVVQVNPFLHERDLDRNPEKDCRNEAGWKAEASAGDALADYFP